MLEGLEDHTREMEELAIHANEIRNYFYDDTKSLTDVIPPVLMVRMDYENFEVAPRKEVDFEKSKLYDKEKAQKASGGKPGAGQKAKEKPEEKKAEVVA
jgi:hypothetical protein